MKVALYKGLTRQNKIIDAMASGIKKYDSVEIVHDQNKIVSADVAVIVYSPSSGQKKKIFQHQQQRKKQTLIIEQPIIRQLPKDNCQHRIGFDDVTRLGEFANYNCPPDRWNSLNIDLEGWGPRGDNIVIVGQCPHDFSLGGLDVNTWYKQVHNDLKKITDKPIRFKPHPKDKSKIPKGLQRVSDKDFWNTTHALVTYSSGMAVDGLIKGVPVFCLSERSFAWDAGNTSLQNINTPIYPLNRNQILYNIAYAQWSISEMEKGLPWKRLREYV